MEPKLLDLTSENLQATLEATPEWAQYFDELTKLAHVKGLFTDGWCGEATGPQFLTERDFYMLESQALGTKQWRDAGGMDINAKYGRGWFTFNASCTMDSGIWEIFVDSSIVDMISAYEL